MDEATVEGAEASSVETEAPTEELGTTEQSEGGDSGVSESEQTYTVTIDGEEVEVTLSEALSGYMRQGDYTRKTQQVAEQRESLTYAERLVEALQEDPRTALQALVRAYDINDLFVDANVPEEEPEELDPIERQVRDQQRWIEEQEAQAFERQVNAELDALHSQYGDFDDAELINFMVERKIPDFGDAAKVFVFDRVMGQAKRQQSEREAQQRKENLAPVAGGHGNSTGSVAPGGTAPIRSVRAAFEAALQQHAAD